jgi:hypothetical protein
VGADVEDGEDVGVGEGGDGARLVFEAPDPIGARLVAGADDLDRDGAPKARVAGAVDLTHAPGPQGLEDLVGTEARSGGNRHEGTLPGCRLRAEAYTGCRHAATGINTTPRDRARRAATVNRVLPVSRKYLKELWSAFGGS